VLVSAGVGDAFVSSAEVVAVAVVDDSDAPLSTARSQLFPAVMIVVTRVSSNR
jgi:hypothetical protein